MNNRHTPNLKYINLSHTDLDGISSSIMLRLALGSGYKMNCSYNKVPEKLEVIYDMLSHDRTYTDVFITDLSLDEKDYKTLIELAKRFTDIMFTFIDHHDVDYEAWTPALPNFRLIHTVKASATKITYGLMVNEYGLERNPDLVKYVNHVNAYDIWLDKTEEFKSGFVINEIFWSIGINNFWREYKINQKIKDQHKELYKELMVKKDNHFKNLENNGLLMKTDDQSVMFSVSSDFLAHLTIDFKFGLYVNANPIGGFSFRIGEHVNEEDAKFLKDLISEYDYKDKTSAGGHVRAFGLSLTEMSQENIISVFNDTRDLVKPYLDKIQVNA